MPLFRYKAVTEPGEILEGDMEAPTRAAVIEQLRAQGYLPIRAEEAVGAAGLVDLLRRDIGRKRALSHRDMTMVIRETATLLRAGLPVDQTLDVLVRFAEKPAVREVLKRVVDKVRGGTSLAEAMAAQGDTFDRFCIGMVRAGEAGGALDVALTRTADFMERSQKARQSFKSALLYPAILLISAVISIAIMVTVVIPNFQQIFADAGYELPLPTRIVLATGTIAQGFWWLPVIVVAGIALAVAARRRTLEGRIALDRRLLRLPLLGDLLTKAEVARFGFTLGMLIANGVPLVAALSVAREALDHPAISAAVRRRRKAGQGRQAFRRAAQRHRHVPNARDTSHSHRRGERQARGNAVSRRRPLRWRGAAGDAAAADAARAGADLRHGGVDRRNYHLDTDADAEYQPAGVLKRGFDETLAQANRG